MNPLKIVIADDNKRMVDVIKEVINGEPQLDVVGTATNGEDTVDVIKKTQPDIVLLDIIMPQIDGLTVMQRIREDNDCVNPAFIVISAVGREAVTEDAFNMGATYYVMKPFDNNMLMGGSHVWLQMLAWGLWKGIGWSAIIYIAAISGIDQQLYEAATVDGAGRFQRMWNITVPSLIPTFCVLLLMSIANILSNGMDQYLVFENSTNTSSIMVLDLYVYKLGIGQGQIPLSTVIGMVKSVVSVTLLFAANGISKLIRGESIV